MHLEQTSIDLAQSIHPTKGQRGRKPAQNSLHSAEMYGAVEQGRAASTPIMYPAYDSIPWQAEEGHLKKRTRRQQGLPYQAIFSTAALPPHYIHSQYPIDQYHQQPAPPFHILKPGMALSRQSPSAPPFHGPASPPRPFGGHATTLPPPTFGSQARPMPPPSPQHYQPRFAQGPQAAPSPGLLPNISREPQPTHKRPGSSMSISSMLGGEPERLAPSMSLGAVMSPPQNGARPAPQEYMYKPRSRTPDRASSTLLDGPRQQRSSSGSMIQRPGPFQDLQPPFLMRPNTKYDEQPPSLPYGSTGKEEQDDRRRRTSLSGILQRPNSQPQQSALLSESFSAEIAQPGTDRFGPSTHTGRVPELNASNGAGPSKSSSLSGSYDTRPPAFAAPSRPSATQISPDRNLPQTKSPELRRSSVNGAPNRGLPGLLNGQPGAPPPFHQTDANTTSSTIAQSMMRQDSTQSHSERSNVGDRFDRGRFRQYSPFASSVASHQHGEDQGRKGSDELSQHRVILSLAAESKRGRYSPLPQAVQGAQAQTPVPDAGIKTEHGRVFSGIGSGIGSTSVNAGQNGSRLSASPFRRDEGVARLSEDNLLKMSRSASGFSKRIKRLQDDDGLADGDSSDVKKQGGQNRIAKRSKYTHLSKVNMDEANTSTGQSRKNTPVAGANNMRASTPSATSTYHHHHQRGGPSESLPTFKPRKSVGIRSIVASVIRKPRRHLGGFTYQPKISEGDLTRPAQKSFSISIEPNLPEAFDGENQVNCTYTVKVPRLWLRRRERGLLCAERRLWGCGIYTDDSDPVLAAMHAGFIKAVHLDNIDQTLLDRVSHDQNTKIEGGYNNLPVTPEEPVDDKDLHITLIVMPQLDKYQDSMRFGIRSRAWPENDTHTPHDGMSFMIQKVEFVGDALEARRMGRTGQEKRARLRHEMEERAKALEKMRERARQTKNTNPSHLTKKVPEMSGPRQASSVKPGKEGGTKSTTSAPASKPPELDIGQAPGDWIKQLAVAATA